MTPKEQYYRYGESLGIKINDLQRLKMLADNCQEDMSQEIQSLIDVYKSDILKLKEEFKDSCSVLTVEKIVTLQSVVDNLESKFNKQG
jgi:hypothetical protein